ncbi:3-oxo-tetronate kinase [Szabonella alba]|uniref:3-oxo-tetronate kinase n=1 Tax=Szabonella alba TaxID=2804194 RepID=A0A8K0VAK0_9RHOB|nr:3-oxo-tetronate kinase [Szabonella alba]MBL4917436.1 four-carbon acid sugar kinase family protein [Szabonella alba]
MILGAIADDLTGATDLALMLAREGMRVVQVVGVPDSADFGDAEAVVVAMKSRTNPVDEAVAMSRAALARLQKAGARQIYFKYCSTFDSTPQGNIGPVAEALMADLGSDVTVACPAFPANGRTVFNGHLFVGRQLLSDSPMKDHPLTPMTNSDLVAVLAEQVSAPVGLIAHDSIAAGAEAVRTQIAEAKGFLILDAITDADLRVLGEAIADLPLLTGGSGLALGLPEAYRRRGWLTGAGEAEDFAAPEGPAVMLAGSCSKATRGQIAHAIAAGVPVLKLDPLAIADGRQTVDAALDFVTAATATPLIYSSADPDEVRAAQATLGRDRAGELVEHFLGDVARSLRDRGFRRFLVAGGETSGAVVTALGVSAMKIGPEIDPGVPWTVSLGDTPLALALKSGNFGAEDFFTKAWTLL